MAVVQTLVDVIQLTLPFASGPLLFTTELRRFGRMRFAIPV